MGNKHSSSKGPCSIAMLVYRSVRFILGAQHIRCKLFFLHAWSLLMSSGSDLDGYFGRTSSKVGLLPKGHLPSFTIKKSTKCRYICQSHGSYGVWDWYASLVHVMVLRQKNRRIPAQKGWTELKNSDPSMDGSARHFSATQWFHSP